MNIYYIRYILDMKICSVIAILHPTTVAAENISLWDL